MSTSTIPADHTAGPGLTIAGTTPLLQADSDYDVIVIGCGVAGSALGHALGKLGRKTLVLERDLTEPDRIVGELLQPGGYRALQRLGLAHCTEDIDAIPCHGYHIQSPERRQIAIPYPLVPASEQHLWPQQKANNAADGVRYYGRSFHHGRFIQRLRQACVDTKGVTLVEGTVTRLLRCSVTNRAVGVRCYVKASSEQQTSGSADRVYRQFYAPLTVVADGCFSKFRKECGAPAPVTVSHFCGFILKDCPLPSPQHGHVFLTPNSPILMYQVDSHETRVLVDVQGPLPSIGNGAMKRYMLENVAAEFPKPVEACFREALEQERLRVMPNSRLTGELQQEDGVLMLGDALNMRHPLTGAGMSVAFNDIVVLRDILSPTQLPDLWDDVTVRRHIAEFHKKRKAHACVLNVLAHGIYTIFAADPNDPQMKVMQTACFDYFCLGGPCVDGPVGLLGGIYHSPLLLLGHFYMVAMYGVWLLLTGQAGPRGKQSSSLPGTLLALPVHLFRCVLTLWAASWLLLPAMLAEFMA